MKEMNLLTLSWGEASPLKNSWNSIDPAAPSGFMGTLATIGRGFPTRTHGTIGQHLQGPWGHWLQLIGVSRAWLSRTFRVHGDIGHYL